MKREGSQQEPRSKCWKMGGGVQGVGWSNPTNFLERSAKEWIANFASSRMVRDLCVKKKMLVMKENAPDALQEQMPTLERPA